MFSSLFVELLTHLRYFHFHSYSFDHFLYFKPFFSSPLLVFAWFSHLPCECTLRCFCLLFQLLSFFHPVLVVLYFLCIYSFSCAISSPFLQSCMFLIYNCIHFLLFCDNFSSSCPFGCIFCFCWLLFPAFSATISHLSVRLARIFCFFAYYFLCF